MDTHMQIFNRLAKVVNPMRGPKSPPIHTAKSTKTDRSGRSARKPSHKFKNERIVANKNKRIAKDSGRANLMPCGHGERHRRYFHDGALSGCIRCIREK